LLFAVLISGVASFSSAPSFVGTRTASSNSKSVLYNFPENFDRAVECSNKYGTCNIFELEGLADGKFFSLHIYIYILLLLSPHHLLTFLSISLLLFSNDAQRIGRL
jgi:hypothetical protein